MPKKTVLTKRQAGIVDQVERYLCLSLVPTAKYVKNAVISLETNSLNQQQLHSIEWYGRQSGQYQVEPCGWRRVCLILKKTAQAGEGGEV